MKAMVLSTRNNRVKLSSHLWAESLQREIQSKATDIEKKNLLSSAEIAKDSRKNHQIARKSQPWVEIQALPDAMKEEISLTWLQPTDTNIHDCLTISVFIISKHIIKIYGIRKQQTLNPSIHRASQRDIASLGRLRVNPWSFLWFRLGINQLKGFPLRPWTSQRFNLITKTSL